MVHSIILGGTKGLGLALAQESSLRDVPPVIFGRTAKDDSVKQELPQDAICQELDLTDEKSISRVDTSSLNTKYFFWVSGVFLKKRLAETSLYEIDRMIAIHLSGPLKFIQKFHKAQEAPYHFITIASCSSWRLREDEAIYCSLKSAKATFTRNFAVEMTRDLPGSKVTLINPGGLNTPNFWKETQQNTSGFLDPNKIAALIWDKIQMQSTDFLELQILRKKPVVVGSEPIVESGAKLPETLK